MIFLFLARLRLLSSKSIPKIIKDCYGENVLKLVRKFGGTDLRCRKAEVDLCFLKCCFQNSLRPTFLHSKVSNQSLKLSNAYKQCQIRSKKKFLTTSPLLDKKVYFDKMNEILNKNEQFLKLSIQEEKHYNLLINLEKKIREPIKELYLDI